MKWLQVALDGHSLSEKSFGGPLCEWEWSDTSRSSIKFWKQTNSTVIKKIYYNDEV